VPPLVVPIPRTPPAAPTPAEGPSLEALARPLLTAAADARWWAADLRAAGLPAHARAAERHGEGLARLGRAVLNGDARRRLF
jgi:hypothetical protein